MAITDCIDDLAQSVASLEGLVERFRAEAITAPQPPAGYTLTGPASPAAFQDFIRSLPDGSTGYIRGEIGGGINTGTVTMSGKGVTIAGVPGEAAVYTGPQFRIYGEANSVYGVGFAQKGVAGKCIEIGGADHSIRSCDLTNFDGAGNVDSQGRGAMILVGGATQATRFVADGNFFHEIGRRPTTSPTDNIRDHALYIQYARDCRVTNNRVRNVRGGYFVHLYGGSGTTQQNTVVLNNYSFDSYFSVISQGATGTLIGGNYMLATFSGVRATSLTSWNVPTTGPKNVFANNHALNTANGTNGISDAASITQYATDTTAYRFVDPSKGDFRLVR